MQHDLKRLVAYSSVAHLGFIVLGTFSLNTEGLEGSLRAMDTGKGARSMDPWLSAQQRKCVMN